MTEPQALADQISEILAEDPVCNGRVSSWAVEQIAALTRPEPSGEAGGEVQALALSRLLAAAMREALHDARLQLEYLDERFPTGTTPAIITRINAALASLPQAEPAGDLVERVARALLGVEESWNDHEWEQLPRGVQALFHKQARAALTASGPGVASQPGEVVQADQPLDQPVPDRIWLTNGGDGILWSGDLEVGELGVPYVRDHRLASQPTEVGEIVISTLRDARDNGLIYWEPNTVRGAVAKSAMLARIDRILTPTTEAESGDE
jgi:hypothetical protein